jgi:hypothetical protein
MDGWGKVTWLSNLGGACMHLCKNISLSLVANVVWKPSAASNTVLAQRYETAFGR